MQGLDTSSNKRPVLEFPMLPPPPPAMTYPCFIPTTPACVSDNDS